MITVTLDIETLTPTWKPPEDNPGAFPPLGKHQPIVISWLVADTQKREFDLNAEVTEDNDAEHIALVKLGEDLRCCSRLVTWNGRGFDMPLLGMRAMAHGVPWGFWHRMRHRYENYKKALVHYDLMDQLGDQGGTRGIKLDHVCEMNGLPGKDQINGSQVGEQWAKGKCDSVIQYCAEDVLHTWLLYLRFLKTFCEKPVEPFWAITVKWARNHDLLKRVAEKIPEVYP